MDSDGLSENGRPFAVSRAFLVLLLLVSVSSALFYVEASRKKIVGGVSDGEYVSVEIIGVYMDSLSSTPVVYLFEPNKEIYLPIWIGANEAVAIQSELAGVKPPRPLTNDLLKSVMEKLDGTLEGVNITKVEDDTFFAELIVRKKDDDQAMQIDARPSDAIGLAIRFKCPIQVNQEVLKTYGISSDSDRRRQASTKKS